MNIVILDGHLVNPGDLSWKEVEDLGNLKVYDDTPEELVEERTKDADIILLNGAFLTGNIIKDSKNLKYVSMLATGYDNVDIEECKRRNIKVSNVPSYGTNTVAQFTFSLLLEICNNVKIHSDKVMDGYYFDENKYGLPVTKQYELAGKTMGIIGYGKIGRRVSEIAKSFGINILAYRGENKEKLYEEEVSVDYLLENSDIISLHGKLTSENAKIINKNNISKMKDGVILINVARGGLVDEEDLAEALNSGKIAAAAVDVVTEEPIKENNPLLKAKNILITPHIAWTTKEARGNIIKTTAENIKAFIDGNPINVVNE